MIVPTTLFAAWRARFYTWDNFMLQEIVHTLLKFAIAIELSYRTFRAFPTANRTGRLAILVVFLLTAVVVQSAPVGRPDGHAARMARARPQRHDLAVRRGRLRDPLVSDTRGSVSQGDPDGFVPYLLVFSLTQRAFADSGEEVRWLQRASPLAYTALSCTGTARPGRARSAAAGLDARCREAA